jgi:hypothetical protein
MLQSERSVESEWLMVLTRYHLENWNANANEQINYDNATIF